MNNKKILLPITYSRRGYVAKPDNKDIIEIHKNAITANMSIDALADRISKGHSFFGGIFKNEKHRKDTFDIGSIIVLDADDGKLTYKTFINFCKKNNIMPNIAYESWSHTARHNKFHAIWVIGEAKLETLEAISKYMFFALSKAFPKTKLDDKMKSPTQLWGGTNKKVEVFHYDYLNFFNFEKLLLSLYSKGSHSRIKKEVKEYSGIKAVRNCEDILGIPNYYQQGQDIYEVVLDENLVKSRNFKFEITDSSQEVLLSNCRLIKELTTSKQDYYNHDINFNVLINLVNVANGRDLYLQMCDLNGTKKLQKYKSDYNCAKNYNPSKCEKYCPYANSCRYGKRTMAYASKRTAYKKQKHNPETVKTISLEEASEQLQRIFLDTILNDTNRLNNVKIVDLVKIGTGVGKTHGMIELLKNTADFYAMWQNDDEIKATIPGFIYAAPTHKLALQTYNDLLVDVVDKYEYNDAEGNTETITEYSDNYNIRKMGIVYITPRPTLLDEDLEEKVAYAEETGFFEIATDIQKKYHKELIKKKNKYEEQEDIDNEDYKNICQYLEEVKEWLQVRREALDSRLIICTHAYLKTMKLEIYRNINVVMIDEDIVDACSNQITMDMVDIKNMGRILENSTWTYYKKEYYYEDLEDIIDFIKNADDEKIYTYNSSDRLYYTKKTKYKTEKIRGICNAKIKAIGELKKEHKLNFSNLLKIKAFYKKDGELFIQTLDTIDLKDKKAVIFSATPAPTQLYSKIFNAEVREHFVDWVKFQGKLIQNSELACFKKDLADLDYLEKVDNYLLSKGIKNVISFKDEIIKKDLEYEYDVKMTFGATAGLNDLKGENFAVIGTYFVNPNSVNLLNAVLQEEGTVSGFELIQNYKVEYQGIKQLIATFKPGFMRDYHLWQCWQNMEQSIGRARLVRTDATVYLLSKLIHPLAYQE